MVFVTYSSQTHSRSVLFDGLCVFRRHLLCTFGTHTGSLNGWFWRYRNNDAKRGFAGLSRNLGKGAGGYNIISSAAVLGHGASWPWSLGRGRGDPAGSWTPPALEARWRTFPSTMFFHTRLSPPRQHICLMGLEKDRETEQTH